MQRKTAKKQPKRFTRLALIEYNFGDILYLAFHGICVQLAHIATAVLLVDGFDV